MDIQIIIPIYKPDDKFLMLLKQLKKQSLSDIPVLIIDSLSNDEYINEIANMNCQVEKITPNSFNHGGTRQMGVELFPNKDIFIFFTQDAIPADNFAIEKLIAVFKNENVGCAYGRQLPYADADLFGAYARAFNYGVKNYIYTIDARKKYGMKTVFMSNSFAAYRKTALKDVGGFPTNTILGEDTYVAAKMLMQNWSVAYCADAKVYHSHDYTIVQEFKRYFDIGVFHAQEVWIRDNFGNAEGAGKKFIQSEILYLLKLNPLLIFSMFMRDGMKFIGYKLGLNEKHLSNKLKKILSMNTRYWV